MFTAALLLSILPQVAGVQPRGAPVPGGWSFVGPVTSGGAVSPFDFDDAGTGYLATQAGIFRSPDSSAWTRIDEGFGLYFDQVRALVAGSSPNTVLAGVCGAGVFRTRDGGGTWLPADAGLGKTACVQKMVRSGGTVFLGASDGLYRSTDSGSSWSLLDRGMGRQNVTAIAVDPVRSSIVYAGTYGAGVFKSVDGGVSWSQTGLASEGTPTTPGIYAISVAPSDSQVVYAGAYRRTFRSADGGASWSILPPRVVLFSGQELGGSTSLAIDPRDSSTVYAFDDQGSWKSVDAGRSWASLGIGPGGFSSQIRVDSAPGFPVTASNGGGLQRSFNGGIGWQALCPGFRPVGLARVVGLSHGTRMYAVPLTFDPPFLLVTSDRGSTWTGLPNAPETFGTFGTITIDPEDERVLYVGTFGGVFKTADGGNSWSSVQQGLPDEPARSIAVDPGRPGHVLVAVASAGFDHGGAVYSSDDGGAHWSPTSLGVVVSDLVFDPTDGHVAYAAAEDQGIFKSVDGGVTWASVNSGLPDLRVPSLSVDRFSSSSLFAVAGTHVVASPDAGSTWRELDGSLALYSFPTWVLADPLRPATVFAGDYDGPWELDPRTERWSRLVPESFPISPYFRYGSRPVLVTDSPSGPVLFLPNERLGLFRQDRAWPGSPSEIPFR